ncbi:hypothetical protein HNR03_000196 [Pseudomonas sp. JAI111]|uniref:DUF2934 domain-containing protein n=1 Tax=Pseudomonas sp. JAI111 TaxID=2735913 RepID=UPI00216A6166|nr:DUF2934 domain-containing protein [Pseudomonas sp. JAI111]MCS3835616.1 hypothetical protein [Pseudomonas sp. JAI111]
MDEQKIREAAYRLWEKQGKPQGQDLEHWFTAENSVSEEDFDKPVPSSSERPALPKDKSADRAKGQKRKSVGN